MTGAMMCLLAISYIPRDVHIPVDEVDLMEVNHIYDKKGETQLDQVIFWEIVRDTRFAKPQWKVVSYHILRNCRESLTIGEYAKKNQSFQRAWDRKHPKARIIPNYSPKWLGGQEVPYRCHRTRRWVMQYKDRQRGKIRRIASRAYMVSWTQYDREVENKQLYPASSRRGLCQKKVQPGKVQ